MPEVSVSTILSLRICMVAMSIDRPCMRIAVVGNRCAARSKFSDDSSSAFGRYAADVQAGATEARPAFRILPLVYARGRQPELGSANGGNIAARTGADDDDVEHLRHATPPV